jgi:hypothetical protein
MNGYYWILMVHNAFHCEQKDSFIILYRYINNKFQSKCCNCAHTFSRSGKRIRESGFRQSSRIQIPFFRGIATVLILLKLVINLLSVLFMSAYIYF